MAVLLAEHHHVVTHTGDGQVAGIADGIEDGYLLVFDGKLSRMVYLSHHGVMEIAQAHGHHRVLDQACVYQRFLDFLSHLLTRQVCHMNGSQHREIDIALAVYGIVISILAYVGATTAVTARKVEELGNLLVLALYADIQLICRFYSDHLILQINHSLRIIRKILEILDV